jgi:type II secretory pathway predicted ATPase ExeA
MFLEYYNLRQQPFGVTPDPAYLYPTRTHGEALRSLFAGIQDGRGFFALIAEPGMGKTTLLYQLLDELHDTARTVFLFQTQCDSREFFQYLLNELGVDTRGMDLVSMHGKLNEILFGEMIAGRRFVLIVDEAQNLEDSVLETVRLLSNFETSYAKMLQIVLAGQPQLSDKLALPQLAQLRQRLALVARLEPLSAAETANYIDHRLKVAGYSGVPLFTPEAVSLIAEASLGIPRTINNLCYGALLAGQARACQTISAEIVREVVSKLAVSIPNDRKKSSVTEQRAVAVEPAALEPAIAPAIDRAMVDPPVADLTLADQLEVPAELPPELPAERTREEEQSSPQAALRLTYAPARKIRLPRWAFRVFAVAGTLFLAGVSLTAFMLRLKEPETLRTGSAPAAAKAIATPPPPPVADAITAAAASAPAPPVSARESAKTDYTADPEETGATQIITVAAMPGQTIEEISLSYSGRFDAALLKEIRALNPEMRDPDHLSAGQLIRLPLPRGSFKKGKDLTSEK